MLIDEIKKHIKMKRKNVFNGWKVFHKLNKENSFTHNAVVVMMPNDEERVKLYALLYLEDLIFTRNSDDVYLITSDPLIKKLVPVFAPHWNIRVLQVRTEELARLIDYSELRNFDPRVVVASFEQPFGRYATNMIGSKGIDAEHVFAVAVYNLWLYNERQLPRYEGADAEISDYLSRAEAMRKTWKY